MMESARRSANHYKHNNQKNHGADNNNKRMPVQTMIKEQYKYSELTSKIIGCAMAVHKALGNGFQEVIYQRALAIEFTFQGIQFVREQEMELFYREQPIGTRRVDFFAEGKVMVEIKAIEQLLEVHKAQAINYCEAYNIADGLLINFGSTSLDFKRVYNKNLVNPKIT